MHYFLADDIALYHRQSFGQALGLRGRIGLLIVDFVNGFADPACLGGGNIKAAIDRSRLLLLFARERGWDVAHSRIVFADDAADANIFTEKVPALLRLTENAAESAIVPCLAPRPDELIIRKTNASAFQGTSLAPWLAARQTQSLVFAGCTTSGCVRASVVDAMAHGFRPTVVEDCVGDRAEGPHKASLFDMRQKYADVLSLERLTENVLAADQGTTSHRSSRAGSGRKL